MINPFFYRLIGAGLLLMALPAFLFANKSEKRINYGSIVDIEVLLDTIPHTKPPEKKPEENRPNIKEVPKSRRQLKPRGVIDRIKVKPVRIPRPRIIKHPILRLIR